MPQLPGPTSTDTAADPAAQSDAPSPPGTRPAGSTRFAALDGLRGVAAVVVVVFHALLVRSDFEDPAPGVRPDELSWWLTHTPLYVFWAGPQAVFVFFVLSGFVLAVPATTRAMRWRSYYPRRLLRLYLPVWGSLALALLMAEIVPRVPQPGLSGWLDAHAPVQPLAQTARDALLLLGTGWINSPLWSLRWEVLFSLLLPLYLLGARVWRRALLVKVAALLLLVGASVATGSEPVTYLSMFALGTLLAFERHRVQAAWDRLVAPSRSSKGVVLTGGALLLGCEFALVLVGVEGRLLVAVAAALQVVGACSAVVLALHWAPAKSLLTLPVVLWVGSRSFSLYLTHEPLLVSLVMLVPTLSPWALVPLVLIASLLLAEVFFRLVEAPSQRLSRRVP